jgi:hypothetical protein
MYLLERDAGNGGKELAISAKKKELLTTYLSQEIEDAFAARGMQEAVWNECLHLYEAIPDQEVRDTPIEGFRNIEVPLIAISTDAIYAQAVDLIFTIAPIVTVQAVSASEIEGAKGLQRFTNWGANSLFGVRNAAEHAILDNVQLGSGFYYCPWVERRRKTKTDQLLIGGPKIFSIPPEDFLVPGGASEDLQTLPWVAMRVYLTAGEFSMRAIKGNWDTEGVMPTGSVEWVRSRRELLGRTAKSGKGQSDLFEVMDVYVNFDIDGDGIDEDLLVTWDRTGNKPLKIRYNPYDERPFAAMRYQLRSHLFYGIGVAEMLRVLQREESEIHNHRMINMFLANTRMFASVSGTLPGTIQIWPGRNLSVSNTDDIKELKLSEVYPSSAQAEAAVISMAERRVGINDLALPRPSQVLGSRTPGITMMSLMQQQNRRFTPAFDGVRLATAEAVKQCLYRVQERLLAEGNDGKTHQLMLKVCGAEAGEAIMLLKDQEFDEAVKIELTASSAQQNREVERQNQLLLVNIMTGYYKSTLELSIVASNPQTPPPVKEVADKIIKASREVMERTLRTFDAIRDPEGLLIEMENAEAQATAGAPQAGLDGLGAIMGMLGNMGAATPGPPNGAVPALGSA